MFWMTVAIVVGGFITAYLRGWEMSLVVTAALPALLFTGFIYAWMISQQTAVVQRVYDKAGGRAEQALQNIKTIKSLQGEEYEIKVYASELFKGQQIVFRYGIWIALAFGFMFFVMFANYSLAFYFGSTLVENQTRNQLFKRTYTVGDVITIFFGITMGGFSLGQASPCLKSFAQGKEAGYQVLQVIDRKPLIADNPNGKTIPHISGHIKFNNVHFTYPSKPDITVLNSINIDIQPMKKTAFVGESGSGKSTIIQLIERFYDPVSGSVEIDGVNIKDLSLTWLRQNIGYVG